MWKKLKKRYVILALLASGLILIVYSAQKGCSKESTMEYEYESVTLGDVRKTISASGKLELFDTTVVVSGLNGIAKNVVVDFNQFVRQGDLLAEIDSPETDANLVNYAETYKRTQIELDSTKDYYESKKKLFEDSLVSQKEVDEARRNYEKTLTVFNQTKLTYNNFLGASNSKRVYANTSGMILQRSIEPKMPVVAGKELFVIAPDMKRMKLIVNVDESDIGYVRKGLIVEFSVSAYPDKVFSGEIRQVRMNPVLVPAGGNKVVTYEALVECANTDMLLRPGMTVTALVNIDRRTGVIRVTNRAFMISPLPVDNQIGKKYVWRRTRLSVKDVPMDRLEVKTGLIGDDYAEITNNVLKDGDEVLVGMHKKFDIKGIPNGK
jgi:HlyD family secretion protein